MRLYERGSFPYFFQELFSPRGGVKRIAAANVEPIDRVIEFSHTGTWMQDDAAMRRDCLGVSLS